MKSVVKILLTLIAPSISMFAYAVPPGTYTCPDIATMNNNIGTYFCKTFPAQPTTYVIGWYPSNYFNNNNFLFENSVDNTIDAPDNQCPKLIPKIRITHLYKVQLVRYGGRKGMECHYSANINIKGLPIPASVLSSTYDRYDFSNCQVQGYSVICK
jgi:hypothetical protein